MASIETLREIHLYSAGHRHLVERATGCGCFYCKAMFPASEIELWCDDPEGGLDKGTTALCPRCGIDSVLPNNIPGIELTSALLEEMQRHFF